MSELPPIDATYPMPPQITRDADGYYLRADGVRFADPDGRLIVNLPKRWRSPRDGAPE